MFKTSHRRPGGRNALPMLAAGLALFLARPATAQETVPFAAGYQGDFMITFGTGPDGTDDLVFSGGGIGRHLGRSVVDGHSTTRPIPTDPFCSEIVTDRVILTAANGDELWLVNSGEDCLDFSIPGHIFIRGSGTFTVAGGTGWFQGATGSGQFRVVAEVTGFVLGGVAGSFDLRFEGSISPPGD